MSNRKLIADMMPDTEDTLRAMRGTAPQIMFCPNRHPLPHRMTWGRCSPVLCADFGERGTVNVTGRDSASRTTPYHQEMDALPRGAESEAYKPASDEGEAEEIKARSKEGLAIMRARGINAARYAVFDFPDIPKAPPIEPGKEKEYVERRLDQATPLAAAELIYQLQYGPAEVRREMARDILERRGHPKRTEAMPETRGPVVILQLSGGNPYDVQRQQTLKRVQEKVNHGQPEQSGQQQRRQSPQLAHLLGEAEHEAER